MDRMRVHTRVADERRMELEREVRARDRSVDRQDMGTCPGAGRLARRRFAINRQLKVDLRPIGHSCTVAPTPVTVEATGVARMTPPGLLLGPGSAETASGRCSRRSAGSRSARGRSQAWLSA
jgi:hypothetical protein